ncbi:hypothetical protein QQP08_004582 [Theobroma cacao]|nr:hypothetical protein QQP08_004582 [Theobroma cacao]
MAEKREDIKRSIYIHVHNNLDTGSQSNRWYVINPRPEVDSILYVICGWDSVENTFSNFVRCLDTHNPSNGWKTCFTLPFDCCEALSAFCGKWMYIIGGNYEVYPTHSFPFSWGLVFNLDCKLEKLYALRAPGIGEFPEASAAFLGGLLVFIPDENALYIHNPVHRKWGVYKSNDVIDEDEWDFCVVSGGILYFYYIEDGKLFAYDLIQRQRLTPIKVPDSLKIPDDCIAGGTPSLVSVANSNLCFIWGESTSRTHMCLCYTKFLVCHGNSPHIVIEDQQYFHIEAFFVLNVVAFDPWSDEESSSRLMIRAAHPSPDGSSEVPQKKKAKSSDQTTKKIKMDDSTKKGGGASSGKPKGAATNSGRKTKEDRKVDGKSKDGSKSVSKSENDNVTKAKDHTPKNDSKSGDIALKVGNKSKNEECGDSPKSTKSKMMAVLHNKLPQNQSKTLQRQPSPSKKPSGFPPILRVSL